jgi:hypothetical protein
LTQDLTLCRHLATPDPIVTPESQVTVPCLAIIGPKSGPLERFQFSSDWYRIVLNDPITGPPFGLGVQNIVSLCNNGQKAFCDRITFGTNASSGLQQVLTVNNTTVNLGSFETRGVDFEASYLLPLQRLDCNWHGNLPAADFAALRHDRRYRSR